MGDVVFRRIRGRLVPIRTTSRNVEKYGNMESIKAGAAAGVGTGGAVYGAGKAAQYGLFKRASRLFSIAKGYAQRNAPRLQLSAAPIKARRGRPKKVGTLAADMFQQASFKKAQNVHFHNQMRADRFRKPAEALRKMSSFVGRHSIKAAVVAGLAVGAATYFNHANSAWKRRGRK